TALLPKAEAAFRAAQERLNEARGQLVQAESRLQVEQAKLAHVGQGAHALEQRRERLQAEMQALVEPEAAAMNAVAARMSSLGADARAAQTNLEALQEDVAALEARRAEAAEALSAVEREHAAAEAQLATLRQIQAAVDENAPLGEWLERHRLGGASRL